MGRPAERQSLSASQAAEPQVAADLNERNLEKPRFMTAGLSFPRNYGAHRAPLQQADPLPSLAKCLLEETAVIE